MCVLTPTAATPREALELVTGLWTGLGAELRFLAPALHDALLARLSHLPNLVAFGLLRALAARLSPADLQLAGGALRDFTRVTKSPTGMWRDICVDNREAIGEALDEFLIHLRELREAVARGDGEGIEEFLRDAGEARGRIWAE
jgi:prephenate dehydrogenase